MGVFSKIDHLIKYNIHDHRMFKTNYGLQALRGLIYKDRVSKLSKIKAGDRQFSIPKDSGFAKWDTKGFALMDEVMAKAKELHADQLPWINETVEQIKQGNLPPSFDTNPFLNLSIDSERNLNSPFLKLALHPSVLKAIGDYLGMVPILSSISYWYSPNITERDSSSQRFHLDNHDRRCAKIFIYINDVDADTGPLTVISKKASLKLEKDLDYHNRMAKTNDSRVQDEEVAKLVDPKEIHQLTGESGSFFLADTDACFHYGSRNAKKPRLALQFYYETPYAFSHPIDYSDQSLFKFSNLVADTDNEIEKMVLGS